MKKFTFFCIVLMVMTVQTYAQGVGINATGVAPDSSAMLDVAGTNRGFLLPRFNLTTTSFTPARPQSYLMVFDTVGTINAGSRFNTGRGLYFNAGTPAAPSWRRFLTSADSTVFWGTRGNVAASGDFIGTTNQEFFSIRTDNIERMRFGYLKPTPPTVSNDIVVVNTRALELPQGTISTPVFRFSNSSNQAGIFGSGVNGIGITSQGDGGGAKFFLSIGGARISTQSTFQTPQANMLMHVEGNIYTTSKIVYSGSSSTTVSTPSGTTDQPLTGNVNRYWSSTFSGNGTSLVIFNSDAPLERFVINRTVNNYRIRVSSQSPGGGTFPRDFSWSGYSIPGGSVAGTINVPDGTTYVDIPFDMTGANSTHIIHLTRRVTSGGNNTLPTYRITVMLNGDTDYVRVLFEMYTTEP